jgi:hypothetical protein
MADILSFEDFKRSKVHDKKLKEIDNVMKTLGSCQKMLLTHKEYLLIQNLMKTIDTYAEQFLKIKEVEELHYEYHTTKGLVKNEPEKIRD